MWVFVVSVNLDKEISKSYWTSYGKERVQKDTLGGSILMGKRPLSLQDTG